MLKKISPQLNIAEVALPDLEEFQEKPEQVLVCRQTFEVTGIWQIFSAFYERFRIPPTFFIYVFLLVFSEASCGFSLKSLFFLKTYFFLKNYSLERPYLQSSFFFFSPILTHSYHASSSKRPWKWSLQPKDGQKQNLEGEYFLRLRHKVIMLYYIIGKSKNDIFRGSGALKFENLPLRGQPWWPLTDTLKIPAKMFSEGLRRRY